MSDQDNTNKSTPVPSPAEISQKTEQARFESGGSGAELCPSCPIHIAGIYDDKWCTPVTGGQYSLAINGEMKVPKGTLTDVDDVPKFSNTTQMQLGSAVYKRQPNESVTPVELKLIAKKELTMEEIAKKSSKRLCMI